MSYDTVKIIRIKDKRLGAIHYLFMLAIIGYIIGYQIVWDHRYVISAVPNGSVRISLQVPDQRTPSHNLPYCNTYDGNSSTVDVDMRNYCTYLDQDFVLLPSNIGDNSMFITTRITESSQTLANNCSLSEYNCTYATTSNQTTYVADIEEFTVLLDHFMFTVRPPHQATGRQLTGRIVNLNGQDVPLSKGEMVGTKDQFDILKLSTILKAAGVNSLDEPGAYRKNLTKRYEGIVVVLFLNYTNLHTYNLANLQYFFSAQVIEGAYFKFEQPIYSKNIKDRVIWNRHGIRLVIIPTGNYGAFDFPTALITFASGLGLVAVSTLVVDFLATYLLPQKKIYHQYKISETTLNTDGSDYNRYS
uniref:Purinergic receptor n=1 Tax=Arcella intermedia TaxID=1963864 RepID=A0A6B2L7S8_9EUKA